jgi:putative spermidine/putrescine transport system permease protein
LDFTFDRTVFDWLNRSRRGLNLLKSKAKLLQLVVTLSACAFLLVPTILSVMAGLTANYFKGISSGLTLKWVYQVWELYADSIFLSIWLALACLICTLLIGLPAAYGLARHPGWLSRLLEEFISLPLAVPGLALALALLQLYGSMKGFRASWAFILVGHVLYTLPFMVRSILAVLAAMDLKTLEEGAASLGASPWQRFRDIVVPNAMPGILAGALTVVTLSIGEFNLTWMLHTPYLKTLPVGLADSYASMRLEIASAYTLVFFVMIVPLLMAMQWASARAQRITQ